MPAKLSSPVSSLRQQYDVVVVGSGYGGAIAASRLARAGKSVCVLERGKEYAEGDYPGGGTDQVTSQIGTPVGRVGDEDALYQIYAHGDVRVGVGCGLGGGSLINAGIVMRPDARVFAHPRWPEAIRRDPAAALDEYYDLAYRMLGPSTYPDDAPRLRKLKAFNDAAAATGKTARLIPMTVAFKDGVNAVGVHQRACILCGECAAGCNHGAKGTLYMNYLPDARRHGAEFYTGVRVHHVEKSGEGWVVRYGLVGSRRDRFTTVPLWVRAKVVILAAGALGSTEILLRSREKGLSVSAWLGRGFSANGNYLGVTSGASYRTRVEGQGAEPDRKAPSGPSITSIIDRRDTDDVEDGVAIEDYSYPSFSDRVDLRVALAATIWGGLLAGLARPETPDDDDEQKDPGYVRRLIDLVGNLRERKDDTFKWAMVWLLMGHDDGTGRIELDGPPEAGKVKIKWPKKARRRYSERVDGLLEQLSKSLGGAYFRFGSGFTNHPLGGCPMADEASSGVVDHQGRVFADARGEQVHEGLYVCDAAVIPRSLGINPLWTISALAERTVRMLAESRGWEIDYALPHAHGGQREQGAAQ